MSAEGKKRTRRAKTAAPAKPEATGSEQVDGRVATQFKPGQSGNPKGRPKGSRNKLGENFIADLQADWETNGATVIETVRKDRPHEYLKVVASILPKELNVRVDPLEEIDDDELDAIILAARAAQRLAQEGGGGESEAPSRAPSGVLLS